MTAKKVGKQRWNAGANSNAKTHDAACALKTSLWSEINFFVDEALQKLHSIRIRVKVKASLRFTKS